MQDLDKTKGQLLAKIASLKESLTDQQRQLEQLRQSENKYQNLFRDSAIGMVVVMADGRITRSNKAFCDFIGYSEQELLAKTVLSITHPDDREASSQVIRQSFSSGENIHFFDKRYLHKSGKILWGEVTTTFICDAEGEPSYAIAQVVDINERKQADEERKQAEAALKKAKDELERRVKERTAELQESHAALRQSEQRFRNYFEQSLIGMAATAPDGHWIIVNDRICQIMGYSREELLQRTWVELTHPEDLAKDIDQFNLLLKNEIENYTLDKRFIKKDGSVVYTTINIRAFRTEGGSIDHIVALIEDVTARREVEDALRQSHDELRIIYEQMADGIVISDFENPHPIRANSALCRMLGYSEEELRALLPFQVHPPEVMPIVQAQFEAVARGKAVCIEDLPFLRRDGSLFYADIVSNRIFYDGRFCRISFLHDVTERKRAQESLQRKHRTLKHLLQSSDHERQLIAYEIHDGLAQYLASAIMQFDVYCHLMELNPKDAIQVYEGAMTLLRQSHFEARRLIAGVRPPVLDEAGIIEAIAHLINEKNLEGGPQIEFNKNVIFSRLVPILENAIYRICQEGLSNSCKHSQSEKVLISLLQQNDRLRIEIQDWGTGFNPKNRKDNCFGLTGIRERARLLGGKYRIHSVVGKGTRITVELPLMEREEERFDST